jgi:hypothetical protein
MITRTAPALLILTMPMAATLGEVVVFSDQAEFEAAMPVEGRIVTGVETFAEANIEPAMLILDLDDPLLPGQSNVGADGWGFPKGLAVADLCIQSNLGPNPDAPVANPRGTGGLAVAGPEVAPGWQAENNAPGSVAFVDSTDLVFSDPDLRGVGFKLIVGAWDPLPVTTVHVAVFNGNGQQIAGLDVEHEFGIPLFVGVSSDEAIGRINLYDLNSAPDRGAESVTRVELWSCRPTDINCDGVVNINDVAELLIQWGSCSPAESCPADVDGDGVIGIKDFLSLLSDWG